MKGLKIRKV